MSAQPATELAPERIQALLTTARYGRSLRWLALTDSTNDDAQRDAAGGAKDGHVVLADAQRSGRGSHGRNWSSPAGTDLYLSIVARPALPLAKLPPLTLAAGLGVREAVQACLSADSPATEVKWPNDVWIGGKKCAGILVEASSHGAQLGPVVIGIGLNVNREVFADELQATATSVRKSAGGRRIDRGVLLAGLLEHVEQWVDRFVRQGGEAVASALQERLALRGRRVRCAELEGVVVGVASSGALQLATGSGIRELIAGTIEPI